MSDYNRRDFIRGGVAASAGLAAFGSIVPQKAQARGLSTEPVLEFKAAPIENVRIGYVGVGVMGSSHITNLLKIKGCQITAVCDIVPSRVERIQQWVVGAGFRKPKGYSRGDWDFKRMCETEDLDLVYTAAPWRWHTPVCVAAMENGKHAATEINAAFTIEECWQLVETAEKRQKHCVMMENCCYDGAEMQILNMVKQNVLGEILHAECGYLHDLRKIKFDGSRGLWRREYSKNHNCNLYPTHGLGPVAQCMDINRGDAFNYLVSMSCNSRGLYEYAENNYPPGDSKRKEVFRLGDVNTSLIRTKMGKTIVVKYDTNLPRPYSRDILVQGTKGIVRKYPAGKIHIEGKTQGHGWEELRKYREYDHPLWKAMEEKAKGAGHGGMDFIEDYRLIEALRTGRPTDFDVYDAAAWSAVVDLSGKSVANRGKPMDFPDFLRGKWKTRRPLHVMEFKG